MLWNGVPRRVLEKHIINRRIIRAILTTYPKAQCRLNLVREPIEISVGSLFSNSQIVEREVCTDRGVAACDIEADADNGYLLAIRGDSTDRHDVSDVPIAHQRGAFGARGHIA